MTCVLMFASIALATHAFATEHESKHLEVADYLEFEQVADPQFSSDGEQIAYTRRYFDRMNDSWHATLRIMDADGSRQRPLIGGSNAR